MKLELIYLIKKQVTKRKFSLFLKFNLIISSVADRYDLSIFFSIKIFIDKDNYRYFVSMYRRHYRYLEKIFK